jgi:hypothetical protein
LLEATESLDDGQLLRFQQTAERLRLKDRYNGLPSDQKSYQANA